MNKKNNHNKKTVKSKLVKYSFSRNLPLDGLLIWIIKLVTMFVFFAPLIIDYNSFFPFVGPRSIIFMGAVQVLFAAYIILVIYYPSFRPKFNLLTIAVFAYLGVLILTTLTGVNPQRSFWSNHERMTGLLMWVHLVAFFVVISSTLKTHREWRTMFAVTVSVAAIVAVIALFDLAGLVNIQGAMDGSTIGNTSFMGVYLLFNAFFAIYLFLKSKSTSRYYFFAVFLLLTVVLFISNAIASILSLVVGFVLILLLYTVFMSRKKYVKVIGTAGISISVVVSIFLGVLLFVPGSIVRQEFIRIDTEARLTVWASAWRGFMERPWLGWGRENFSIPFYRHFDPRLYLPEHGGETWFDRSHNIVLDTLNASGILGLLVYMGLFVLGFVVLWKYFKNSKGDFWTSAIFTSALIAYFIQNLTVFDMINSYMMFVMTLGFLSSLPLLKNDTSHVGKSVRNLSSLYIIPVLIGFFFVFSFFTIFPWLSGSNVARALHHQDFDRMIYFYSRAIGDSPLGRSEIRLFFARQFQTFSTSEQGRQTEKKEIEKVFRYLDEELRRNIKENPFCFQAHINTAIFYNVWAQVDASKATNAREILDKAIVLSPKNQINFWVLAETLQRQNKHAEALEAAEKAVKLEPRLLRSHDMLIRVAVAIGNIEFADDKIQQAIEINPAWKDQLNTLLHVGR